MSQRQEEQPVVRLSLNITARGKKELVALSTASRRSITELIRIGLGLAKDYFEADGKGHKFVEVDADGKTVKDVHNPFRF